MKITDKQMMDWLEAGGRFGKWRGADIKKKYWAETEDGVFQASANTVRQAIAAAIRASRRKKR